MHKFEVGQKVRCIIPPRDDDSCSRLQAGQVYTVLSIDEEMLLLALTVDDYAVLSLFYKWRFEPMEDDHDDSHSASYKSRI